MAKTSESFLQLAAQLRSPRYISASLVETASIEPKIVEHTSPSSITSEFHSFHHRIKAAVLLSRPPILTRDLTPFEKAYFLYQRRLNERLALPFTRYFYYQKGTPGDVEWKRKVKGRLTPARDIGRFSGYGTDAWNDELLVGDGVSEPQEQVKALIRDAEDKEDGSTAGGRKRDELIEKPSERVTKADRTSDLKSLNRSLTRTLYLVVKMKQGATRGEWVLPECAIEGKESLHMAAERLLVQTGGINMNTWVVGNMPICHQVYNYPQSIIDEISGAGTRGEKIFLMQARIMGGRPDLRANKLGILDFQWLDKEEVQKTLLSQDFAAVKNVLADR
ncbi:uncharacterized protein KY384_003221 [Bacidia gigantensis]|uniref:uncharacterized protein n=1 Tax=Bacidia gigantensis TaxID=2732470 RepID=UPI001D05AEF0|nr:uncharacterized protein KY384_003221 [Bacidia gigantensis]KAG8531591.1 hypothetical protein KY384_003221 [Bacidia gigantensis]